MELHPTEPNRMHKLPDGNTGTDAVYQTKNIHIQDNLFFFSDTSQQIKTLRNCLFNSGSGRCSRYI